MFDRKFILLPSRDFLPELAEEFIRYQSKSGKEFSDFLFIMPNRRSGVYLKYYISKRIKGPAFSPEIFSLEDFIDFYYENFVIADVKISLWDALYLLFEIFKEQEIFSDFLDFMPFGEKIFKDFEDFKIYRKNKDAIRTVLQDLELPAISKTKRILESYSEAYDRFYDLVVEKGFSTRSLRYFRVSDEIKNEGWLSEKQICLCPPFLLSESEKILLEKLLEWDNFSVLLQKSKFVLDEYEAYIKRHDFILEQDLRSLKKFQGNVKVDFVPTDDDLSEAFVLEKNLKSLDDDSLNSIQTGVVLPDAQKLMQIVDLGLPEQVRDFNVSMGYPLRLSGYYTFVQDLKELFLYSQIDRERYLFNLRKLRQFLDRNVEIRKDREAVSDFVDFLNSLIDKGYTSLDTLAVNELMVNLSPEEADRLSQIWSRICEGFLMKILNCKNFSDFVNILMEFLSGADSLDVIYRARTEPKGMLEMLLTELMRLRNSLVAEISFPGEKSPLENAVNFLEFLALSVGKISVPLKGTPLKGLQIIGFLEARLLSFKKLFIVDVQESLLPQAEREWDRLMPYDLRLKLNLLDLRSREKLSEYLFFTLIESAEECSIIYKDTELDEPSHFILMLKEYLRESGNLVKEPEHLTFYSNKTISFEVKPSFEEGIMKTPELLDSMKRMVFSYSAIETYLECPVKFLFTYVFGLREEIKDEFDRRRIGSVIHKCLERFFSEAPAEVSKNSPYIEKFDEIAEKVLSQEYPVETPRIRILKEGIKVRVKNALIQLQDQVKKHIERSICGEFLGYRVEEKVSAVLKSQAGDVHFTGIIDRIDFYEDGLVILDYKSSSSVAKYRDGADIEKLWTSLQGAERVSRQVKDQYIQLPVYYWLFQSSYGVGKTMGDLKEKQVFVGVVPLKSKQVKVEMIGYEPQQASEHLVAECLSKIVSEILNPEVEFYIPEDKRRKTVCKWCAFRKVCGV